MPEVIRDISKPLGVDRAIVQEIVVKISRLYVEVVRSTTWTGNRLGTLGLIFQDLSLPRLGKL
jgi:hypothetical protein